MPEPTFQVMFCEHWHCPVSEFEDRILAEYLYPHARLLAPLLKSFASNFFAPDLKLIRRLAMSTDLREALNDLLDFKDANARSNFWRTQLKLRVSGRRAGGLVRTMFQRERAHREESPPAFECFQPTAGLTTKSTGRR